jgi:tetratricopeptide (TPR) repeat protein
VPDFLQTWFGSGALAVGLFYAGIVLFLVLAVLLWQTFGRGPIRRRGLRRAERLLEQQQWQEALAIIRGLQSQANLPHAGQTRLWKAEGRCHQAAADEALRAKAFETALDSSLKAAHLLNRSEVEAKAAVVEAMLAELRRLFAEGRGGDTAAVHQFIARTLLVQSPCLEASFWQGLCHLRDGNLELALASLERARGAEIGVSISDPFADELPAKQKRAKAASKLSPFIDPPLYLGALRLRQGPAKESLRYLTEANRIDGNCPFVTVQLGAAMIAAGGDAQLAVRALQRALGPRGLELWAGNPARAWVEAFPENRSFIRKLATKHPFVCPLWGSDWKLLSWQGHVALGQGLYRLGDYQKSGQVFAKLLQESAPSLPVLRGLGLALARQGQYDEAFKHLRTAHEMEEPKDRLTAGYLALCGAKGKPSRPEDKIQNLLWAMRLISAFTAPGDPEWAGLTSAIVAEAREGGLEIAAEDQIYLCEHLLSVKATDPQAAEGFHHLMVTHPEAMRSEYAWLYCRSAQQQGVRGDHALDLFARTFAEEPQARAFFDQQGWDFNELEFTYLRHAASKQPGSFPASLGPNYAARGEKLLLERSAAQEKARHPESAVAAAEILLRLDPRNPRALDRLAYLFYRQGHTDRALEMLQSWHDAVPSDPLPLVRQAVLWQQKNEPDRSQEAIRLARERASGKKRAEIAYLGARLVLKSAAVSPEGLLAATPGAAELLEECLREDAQHWPALWCLAALRWLSGDRASLAGQAGALERPEVPDPRFHFLGAVACLAKEDAEGVLRAGQRVVARCEGGRNGSGEATEAALAEVGAAALPGLVVESAFLIGWANLFKKDWSAAAQAFRLVADSAQSSSASPAKALLGSIAFEDNDFEEAIRWWQALEPKKRKEWGFSEALAGTVLLTALAMFRAGKFEQAAEKIREAGKLGLRDRRLGQLLILSLVKGGQQYLYK